MFKGAGIACRPDVRQARENALQCAGVYSIIASCRKDGYFYRSRRNEVTKVNQEELTQKIQKLKQAAAEKKEKAGGKTADPGVRSARKKVKRAQRKLRAAKAYKSAGKKAEAKTEEKAS